jgi:NAD(P)-dependent dehydrogenase (short-subunit alcohol dehydrogenase family)
MAPIAVITGGGRGIGAATARRLADAGWDLALGYRSDHASADRVAAEILDRGRRAVTVALDVGVEPEAAALFAKVDDELGPVAALVNNAGVVDVSARVDEMDADRLDRMWRTNISGPFLCAREAVRRMSTRHGGTGGAIINVSSAAARHGSPSEYVDYAASKGAIDTFTLGLAKEVATESIRVNAVRPGIIDTDIHASGGQPDRIERIGSIVPMGRGGTADEVAAAIAWLCSDEASYVTGALLDVSGGR